MNFNFSITLITIITAAILVVDAQEARPKIHSGEPKLMLSKAHILEAERKHDPLMDNQSLEVDMSMPWPFAFWCNNFYDMNFRNIHPGWSHVAGGAQLSYALKNCGGNSFKICRDFCELVADNNCNIAQQFLPFV